VYDHAMGRCKWSERAWLLSGSQGETEAEVEMALSWEATVAIIS
jgi:hypothetical protein